MNPTFDLTKNVEEWIIPKKGVDIKIYGFTEESKPWSECGNASISDIFNYEINVKNLQTFGPMIKKLERVGYDFGLTLQAMPYNFFYGLYQNEFNNNFIPVLERLKKITGKKTTIMGHSFGNLVTLYNLDKMDKSKKDSLVSNFIAIAPPFLGSYKAYEYLFAGNRDLTFLNESLGLGQKESRLLV